MEILKLVVVVLATTLVTVGEALLEKRAIGSNSDLAVCCDGSPAVYYSETTDSDNWVLFLEGGGGCTSDEECEERFNNTNTRILLSSNDLPSTLSGRDVLSCEESQNPLFHDFNHVLIPYCSQDAFLANSSLSNSSSFVFRGRVILQSIITDLLPQLQNASRVVFAGSSAGGVGLVNNLDWIQEQLNSTSGSPELSLIIDSSWFIPINGYHAINFSPNDSRFLDISSRACGDFTLGFPCCTALSCLLSREEFFEHKLPPMFLITSLFDSFTLQETLTQFTRFLDFSADTNDINDQDFLRTFNSYAALMNDSLLETHKTLDGVTVFAPSCTQHVYLATSSLWDDGGLLNRTVPSSFMESVFRLTNPIQSGQWSTVTINHTRSSNTSLLEALEVWYSDPQSPLYYADLCNGPSCGECPNDIDLEFSLSQWEEAVDIVVLVLSSLMVATPIVIKIFLYIYMKLMLYKQKLYVYTLSTTERNKPKFPKAVHAVSVSCTGLSYLLDTVDNSKKPAPQNEEQIPGGNYRLSALANTFAPCCKSGCYRYNASIEDVEAGRSSSSFNRLKSDSGISSGIVRSNGSYDSVDNSSMDYILEDSVKKTKSSSLKKKTILKQVNMYVNPGELLAIMGPSGSGKTTLLDVLLGRRRTGHINGKRYVNGVQLLKMREWFISNTGYVRQLATSFYNELTVRENLLFSMNMQSPRGMSIAQKLERVEQVIRETGLEEQADFVVGSGIGLGLSGGQRKRLTIAVQLLSMPNIIFLDEPTSGLDSASSLDILKSLQVMAGTGRAIVVTIHQPRSEIFHAFDKILLLCNGQVAFFGSPVKVWNFFQKALTTEGIQKHEGQVQDQILDHLKSKESQDQVLSSYKKSLEPNKVKSAVLEGREVTDRGSPSPVYKRHPGLWQRLVSLEARASLRQTLFTILYLPIVYTVFGALLGTTYLNTNQPLQVMSVTCLLSCSSSLFMSSIILSLLIEPLKLFQLEHSDGISSSHELVLQAYLRMCFVGALPLSICATLVFGLVYYQEDFRVYVIVLLVFLLLNQVWISVFILLTVLAPSQTHRLCPVSAAVGGFWCGFIIPKPLMPVYYQWVFYINPSFYAYSATSVTVLHGLELECKRASELECFRASGYAALQQFGIASVNPYQNMIILIAMTCLLLVLGVLILELKVSASLIRESLVNWLYTCCRKSKNDTKISSSTDNLNEVDTPVQLRSFRKNRLQAQTKESIQLAAELELSNAFVESSKHQVYHNFPWERLEPGEDQPDGLADDPAVIFSPMSSSSRRSRLVSDVSEDVFEPEFITMSTEADQEERKKQAEAKWETRRIKIESEIRRLREARIHQKATQRHSIASFGDGLEDEFFERRDSAPRKRYLSTANQHQVEEAGVCMELENSPVCKRRFKEKPPFLRATSLPVCETALTRMALPTLETYNEDEESEMMDLPPKDIPTLRDSVEQVDKIDYEAIPPQELSTAASSQGSQESSWSQV